MKQYIIQSIFSLLSLPLLAGYVNGKYTGNGAASKTISGFTFKPSVVLVKGGGSNTGWIATSTMGTGKAKYLSGTDAPSTGYINSFNSNGFTVGNSPEANCAGVTYYFTAWDGTDGSIQLGSFTANDCGDNWKKDIWYNLGSIVKQGSSNYKALVGHTSSNGNKPDSSPATWKDLGSCSTFNTNINLGYRPKMVWIFGEGTNWDEVSPGQFAIDGSNSSLSHHFNSGSSLGPEYQIIDDLTSTGFRIRTPQFPGVHNGPTVGTKYNYVAFVPSSGTKTGTYVADATDNRVVSTGVNAQFVMVVDDGGGQNAWFKTSVMGGDSSYKFTDIVSTMNIKKLDALSFTIGYGGEVNQSGRTFVYFAMGGAISLPVELVSFVAHREENKILLSWETASEINSNVFVVEHSTDATHFDNIGEIMAAGTSNQFRSYSLIDEHPSPGVNYYRLEEIDNDGIAMTSEIVVLDFPRNSLSSLSLFPNMVKGDAQLVFTSEKEQVCSVQIFNLNAVHCYQSVTNVNEGYNELPLLLSSLNSGYYVARITLSGSEVCQLGFVKE
jgi:hypothetical protein